MSDGRTIWLTRQGGSCVARGACVVTAPFLLLLVLVSSEQDHHFKCARYDRTRTLPCTYVAVLVAGRL